MVTERCFRVSFLWDTQNSSRQGAELPAVALKLALLWTGIWTGGFLRYLSTPVVLWTPTGGRFCDAQWNGEPTLFYLLGWITSRKNLLAFFTGKSITLLWTISFCTGGVVCAVSTKVMGMGSGQRSGCQEDKEYITCCFHTRQAISLRRLAFPRKGNEG